MIPCFWGALAENADAVLYTKPHFSSVYAESLPALRTVKPAERHGKFRTQNPTFQARQYGSTEVHYSGNSAPYAEGMEPC
jgi:hypothetical protein